MYSALTLSAAGPARTLLRADPPGCGPAVPVVDHRVSVVVDGNTEGARCAGNRGDADDVSGAGVHGVVVDSDELAPSVTVICQSFPGSVDRGAERGRRARHRDQQERFGRRAGRPRGATIEVDVAVVREVRGAEPDPDAEHRAATRNRRRCAEVEIGRFAPRVARVRPRQSFPLTVLADRDAERRGDTRNRAEPPGSVYPYPRLDLDGVDPVCTVV